MFEAMLTSRMEETVSKCIDLKEYSKTVVKHFLEFVYTGTLLLDGDEDEDDNEDDDEDEDVDEDEHKDMDEHEVEGGTEERGEDEKKSSFIVQLWVMGDKYDVPSLVEHVESLRKEHITVENVIGVYVEADTSEAAPIRDTCLALISKKTKELLGEIEGLPHHVQAKLFQQLIKQGVSF